MTDGPGYHNRRGPICAKIRSLLISLSKEPSNYDQIALKVEYWIEYVLREGFATVDELVEGVSGVGWDDGESYASVARFFREFYDAPNRSEQARSFVSQLCPYVLRWFAIALTEDLWWSSESSLSIRGAPGLISAASFIGHLIDRRLFSHELVRRHLTKSLTSHHDSSDHANSPGATRADAIYQLFIAAGHTLLQGLLEPGDVQACFDILQAWSERKIGVDAVKLKEFRDIHAAWMHLEEQRGLRGSEERQNEGGGDIVDADISAEVKTPVAFVPQDLPDATVGSDIPPSVLSDGDSSLDTFIDIPSGAVSPTLSISTMSDLTPTELGEEIKPGEKQTIAHHDTFYFEDGNVEIVCGGTIFRVHSTIISFASSELREIFSQPALRKAPTPERHPQITTSDSAEDFGMLLKMVYTPGFPERHKVPEFSVFTSLLRMTTKYGFSNVRGQLVEDLKIAYPTKWDDFTSAKVLGEDIFGSPKPHPNAVLKLLETQKVRFAIPFAAYRASIGGFGALMSDKPGTVLPRRSLASTIQGMHGLSTLYSNAARMVAYGGSLRVCSDKACALSVGTKNKAGRAEASEKVYLAMIDNREGGLLVPPALKPLLCTECAKHVEESHATQSLLIWEKLPSLFHLSHGWDDL